MDLVVVLFSPAAMGKLLKSRDAAVLTLLEWIQFYNHVGGFHGQFCFVTNSSFLGLLLLC